MQNELSRRVLLGVTASVAALMATYTATAERAEAAGLITVDQFVAKYRGTFQDADGAFGAQCVDLWKLYCNGVVGGGHFILPSGYAHSIWYDHDRLGRGDLYDKIPSSQPAKKGDVVVWNWNSFNHTQSHVAIAIEDRGANILVFEQNGWPLKSCELQQTTKSGIAGYLRPTFVLGEDMPTAQEIASAIMNYPVARQGAGQGGEATLAGFLAFFDANMRVTEGWINQVPGKTMSAQYPRLGTGQAGVTDLRGTIQYFDANIAGLSQKLDEIKARL